MNDDALFQNHLRSRKLKQDDACAKTGIWFEPYGEDPKMLTSSEESDAKTIDGILEEPPGFRKDFQDSIRVAYFRSLDQSDQKIAEQLRLPIAFVRSCKDPATIAIPKQVPQYIADHGLRCLQDGIEPFRPAELRRNFVQTKSTPSLLRALSASLKWTAAPALKRDYYTGEVWDTGHRLLREKASCGLHTGIPLVDNAIAKIVEEYTIDDPGAYLLCNRYKDGRAFIAPHQHDFWSATFSFGAPRVFLLDKRPLILQEGDVLIFGSQRHSVPKMSNCLGERISLSLFWYPNWRSDCGYENEQVRRWQMESEAEALWAATRASFVEMLSQLGFDLDIIISALDDAADDVDVAATKLLAATNHSKRESRHEDGKTCNFEADQSTLLSAGHGGVDVTEPLDKRRGRWRHKRHDRAQSQCTEASAD